MVKILRKKKNENIITIFLCILIVCNLACYQVLCFGADGHIAVESAFNPCCDEQNSCTPDQSICSSDAEHEKCERCGPCIDIPVTNDLIKNSEARDEFNPRLQAAVKNIVMDIDQVNSSDNITASNIFNAKSYFTPLRTVILLI
jgi:hypothetical protein